MELDSSIAPGWPGPPLRDTSTGQMLVATLLLGFAFGFVGSIPIAGPIAVLVFSRGLEGRVRSALYLASGAALAESGYAYLAFWGFSGFLTRYAWVELASRIATALILTALGLHFMHRSGAGATGLEPGPRAPSKRSFLLGFTVTALNPALIATWTAAVTAMYSLDLVRFDPAAALPFSLGACSGIAAWFALLLGFLQRFRMRISGDALFRLRRGMGVILILLGAVFVAGLA
jgi:threonine/homoserine/homoserine lactone efflux protein